MDWFGPAERVAVAAALDEQVPGASELGAVDYVETLLTALDHEPPRVWAAPERAGGDEPGWLELGVWERHAWEQRIAELRAVYRRIVDGQRQPGDDRVLHHHACEATYGDPAYGGNRRAAGWERIGFPKPLFPPARSDR